ncbi:cyclin domain protein [Onchocerca flexuosa]|uniref:Cyclin domain protein n=1 Tax=Onchocerca flexuosa TaxID=387005 RepID=A0A238BX32_9BILA|nr:cyclin domain protein [Onchocerca flexuosa]
MGNSLCCLQNSSSVARSKEVMYDGKQQVNHEYVNQIFPREDTSNNFLPHISERELPDEIGEDPSTQPMVKPTFMERSRSEMKLKDNRRSFYVLDAQSLTTVMLPLQKSNSCSTIFLDDSTISQPNLKNTIKCISLAIYYHIVNRKNRAHERLMEIFEERLHPITRDPIPIEMMSRDPDHRQIYRFIRTLFHAAQLTAECAIITLVYVERLLNYAEMDLCPSNWRRVVLGAIMLASKVWDDQAVWNVDYCQILKDTNVDDMNELERQFLECLEFNINVPSSVYAKYYYELRTLAMANDLQLPLQPLYKERARKLEALSRIYEDKLQPDLRIMHRKSFSAENIMNSNCYCANEIINFERKDEGMRYTMNSHIDLQKVIVLNEAIEGSGAMIFKKWEDRLDRTIHVESDVDEELLFNVPFKGHVKITGLVLIGDLDGTHPSHIRLYKDRPSMSFEAMAVEADQEFSLKQDINAQIDYPLKASKFSNVTHLSLHFPTNFGESKTRIYYIGLRGEYIEDIRQQVCITTYEARPMLKDHKGEIPDVIQRSVM